MTTENLNKSKEYELLSKRIKSIEENSKRQIILEVNNDVELKFKDEEGKEIWKNYLKEVENPYFKIVFNYTSVWGKYMQYLIEHEQKQLEEIAEYSSHFVDIYGITRNIYSSAVTILSQVWKYGEDLRNWHNKKYGVSNTDGVVNPSVLKLVPKE